MMMKSGKGAAAAGKRCSMSKYLRAPLGVLVRVRDLYVKSMIGCGDNIAYGNAMGCPTPQIRTPPRSFTAVINSTPPNYGTAGKRSMVSSVPPPQSALAVRGGDKAVAPPRRVAFSGVGKIGEEELGKAELLGVVIINSSK